MSFAQAERPVNRGEELWAWGEGRAIAAMTTINLATVALVETIGLMIASDGWCGAGINSIEQWVCWKTNLSRHRALGLIRIADRAEELPYCWGLFVDGRLTEDAMVRIARKVPTSRDREVGELALLMSVSQLSRILTTLPEIEPKPEKDQQRHLRMYERPDGSGMGEFDLPAHEYAVLQTALTAARDAEFRDRNGLEADTDITDSQAHKVSWVDAFIRLASEGTDNLDPTCQRTGHRGERHQVVIHRHLHDDGTLGPARLHKGVHIPDAVARYLGCDAKVVINDYLNGRLTGITVTSRTPNRRLRRYLEHRDGGCAHPLCDQKRWLDAHHILWWENGGLTTPDNLLCLCPTHHRGLHHGDFTITGDPEAGTVRFLDTHGRPIEPPPLGADPLPPPNPPDQLTFRPSCGERLNPRDFGWN
jgi:hypothetical protein